MTPEGTPKGSPRGRSPRRRSIERNKRRRSSSSSSRDSIYSRASKRQKYSRYKRNRGDSRDSSSPTKDCQERSRCMHSACSHRSRDHSCGRQQRTRQLSRDEIMSPRRDRSGHSRGKSRSPPRVSLDGSRICQTPERPSIRTEGTSSGTPSDESLLEKLVKLISSQPTAQSQPITHGAQNVIPSFDPQAKTQTMKTWLHKVNETAQVYGWTDRHKIFYGLPKLQGLAKRWYDSLPSVNFSWEEWQKKLLAAFPNERNYGEILVEMISRRTRTNETLEEYYYDKISLINQCELQEKQAVDCLIHGIDDANIKMNIQGVNPQKADDVLIYFRKLSHKDYERGRKTTNQDRDSVRRFPFSNKDNVKTPNFRKQINLSTSQKPVVTCFNCGKTGHSVRQCTEKLVKCTICQFYGHVEKDCTRSVTSKQTDRPKASSTMTTNSKSVLTITTSGLSNKKYFKEVKVNGMSMTSFIDMGSQCTLLREDYGKQLNLPVETDNLPTLTGFASGRLAPKGRVTIQIDLEGLHESIEAYLVEPTYLPADILIGQSLTELPNVRIYKTDDALIFYKETNEENNRIPISSVRDVLLVGVMSIPFFTRPEVCGSIYVNTNPCMKKDMEYMILPGVYSVDKGSGSVLVVSLTLQPFVLLTGTLLARAVVVSNERVPEATRSETPEMKVNLVETTSITPISQDQIHVDDDLDPDVLEKLCELLNARRECFASSIEDLGQTSLAEMHIELKDKEPVTYRPYRLSISERNKVNTIISSMLSNGIIRESTSEYASPILMVAKKNGDVRLCVDYRAVNRKTVKEKFPMPLIDDQIDSLSEQVYFTALDLTSGYHQVPISEESKHITAFVTPDGHFEYNRMPFGLTNAPAVFQRLILKLLSKRKIPGVLAYMDDIIIASKTIEEGLKKLGEVLELMKEANLTLNLSKCNFFKKSIDYLGFEISCEGVRPGSKKIEAVAAFKTPQNVHEVRQFVGLSSFFRRFVPGFASIAKPLTVLTKVNTKWVWGDEQTRAFEQLKEILTTRPVLAIYNPRYETELHTDASAIGLGGILLQRPDSSSPLKAVAYFSRQTTVEEQKFHSYELETLAVVASLIRFRVYLIGIEFKVVTDCSALRTTLTKRDLIPRIARWWLQVQEFTFSIEYRPGTQLAHADALSRNALNQVEPEKSILQISEVDWSTAVQLADPRISHIKAVLDSKSQEAKDIQNNYTLREGKVYRNVNGELRWAVPKDARWKICQQCHDEAGHFAYDKTLEKMRRSYWFPKMAQFVRKYVKACIPCAHAKYPGGKKQGFLNPIEKPNVPFQCLHVDHLGPFVKSKRGNSYILGVIDSFSKFIILRPVRNTKSVTSISVLRDIFALFGTSKNLISDRGTSFTSNAFKAYIESIGIKHTLNAVATPRANGQIERYNRSILASLTALCHGKDDRNWDTHVPTVQWSLNNTINQGTKKSPTEIVFGKTTVSPSEGHLHEINSERRLTVEDIEKVREEASTNIREKQIAMKERFDKGRCEAVVYKVGDLVMVQKSNKIPGESHKLDAPFQGPFRVTAVLKHDRYEISSVEGYSRRKYKNVFSVDKIKPWVRFSESESESDYGSSD